jgi:hypothetical protein
MAQGGRAAGGSGNRGGAGPLPPALTFAREETANSVYYGIWGSGADDVYAVGASGSVEHSAGDGTWKTQTTDTTAILYGVWGSGPNDVYVAANANLILHSTGDGTWEHQVTASGQTFKDVWGSGPGDVYAVVGGGVIHNDGSWDTQGQTATTSVAKAIWGSSAEDLYLATSYAKTPTIFRSKGDGNWVGDDGSPQVSVSDLWGAAKDRVYAAAGDSVYFSAGDGTWTPELVVSGDAVKAVWAAGPEAVYVCTAMGRVYRSNGAGKWSDAIEIDPGRSEGCLCLWGSGTDDIYVGTDGGLYHGKP